MIGTSTIERKRWVVAVVLAMAVDVSGQCLMPQARPESPMQGDRFGVGVAIDGDVLVVGADQQRADPGEVHAFKWDGFQWQLQNVLGASDPVDFDDGFGAAVDVDGDFIVVGAPGVGELEGAAYVFHWDGSNWIDDGVLMPSDPEVDAGFGTSVAIDGTAIVVGAPGTVFPSEADRGRAFVYRRGSNGWFLEDVLLGAGNAQFDWFGKSVYISGNRVVVGAPLVGFGQARIFQRATIGNFSFWLDVQTLTGSQDDVGFGRAVAVHGDRVAVGAPAVGITQTFEQGAVYFFERSVVFGNVIWSEVDRLMASIGGGGGDRYGWSVVLEGDVAVVGAPAGSFGRESAAFVIDRRTSGWFERDRLLPLQSIESDGFGEAVGLSGGRVPVGAGDRNAFGLRSGVVWVFAVEGSNGDNDAWFDDCDNCPAVANSGQEDADGDGRGDVCDVCPDADDLADADGDTVPDACDGCPNDAAKIDPGACGCGIADDDSDGDGTADCDDDCPNDPDKADAGACGCGTPDDDSDGDGVPDCFDVCADQDDVADSDGDGTIDCFDGCPDDAGKVAPGVCGCGIADGDGDGDGVADCLDNCPLVGNGGQADSDGDGVGDACDDDPTDGGDDDGDEVEPGQDVDGTADATDGGGDADGGSDGLDDDVVSGGTTGRGSGGSGGSGGGGLCGIGLTPFLGLVLVALCDGRLRKKGSKPQ